MEPPDRATTMLPPQSNSLKGSPSPHWASRCLKILLRQTVVLRKNLALVRNLTGPRDKPSD
jgi:hypothetical protein